MTDTFERRYTEPLVELPPLDQHETVRAARAAQARAMPEAPFALHGCVLTPEEALDDHYVVISGAAISDVSARAADAADVIKTRGIVLPN